MGNIADIGMFKTLEVLKQVKQNNLSVLLDMGNKNELTCIKLGLKKIIIPSTVELLHGFFTRDQKTIIKTPRAQEYASQAIGLGIITTDKEEWIKKRTQVKGLYSSQQISSLINTINDCISHNLKPVTDSVSLNGLVATISASVIGHTLFGNFSNDDGEKIIHEVNKMIEPTFKKLISPFPFFVDPFNKLVSTARKNLFSILEMNIAKARASTIHNLVKQYYPSGNCSEDISNLFVAGYETTSNTLFWLFYELSRNKEIKEKISEELNDVKYFENYQDLLKQIPYSMACVSETLRLYPPIWLMGRTSTENFSIGKYYVKSNTDILLSPYIFHRLNKYWELPDKFMPARFFNAETSLSDRPYYFPFGIGSRACVGEKLALMEIYLVLINVFQKYDFEIESKEVILSAHFTLRPSKIISITLNKKEFAK